VISVGEEDDFEKSDFINLITRENSNDLEDEPRRIRLCCKSILENPSTLSILYSNHSYKLLNRTKVIENVDTESNRWSTRIALIARVRLHLPAATQKAQIMPQSGLGSSP
jgi:hypothetical protein